MIESGRTTDGEVISVRRAGVTITSCRDAASDGYLFLDLDESALVVGARLVAANEMPLEHWLRHPDRAELPGDLLAELDRLIREAETERLKPAACDVVLSAAEYAEFLKLLDESPRVIPELLELLRSRKGASTP